MFQLLMNFYVMNIFGGVIRIDGQIKSFTPLIATLWNETTGSYNNITTGDIMVNAFGVTMPIGNYLSFLASIITIIFIVVLCCLFVYKIIKLIGGLIR